MKKFKVTLSFSLFAGISIGFLVKILPNFNRVNQKLYANPRTDIVAHNVPFNARRVFFDTPRVTPLLLVECDVLWDMFFLGDFCQSFRSCNHSDKACYALQLESLYQVH